MAVSPKLCPRRAWQRYCSCCSDSMYAANERCNQLPSHCLPFSCQDVVEIMRQTLDGQAASPDALPMLDFTRVSCSEPYARGG